jgi:hypothetical protein
MAGRVRSGVTIGPVMTGGVDTAGLRDGGFDRDLFGHRVDFRRIDTPSATATRSAVTRMRRGLWSPAMISSGQLAGRSTAGHRMAMDSVGMEPTMT